MRYGRPKSLGNVFCNRSNEPAPGIRSLTELYCQRGSDATITISIFPKVGSAQRLALKPIKDEGVTLRATNFHKVAAQGISARGVAMEQTDFWQKAHGKCRYCRFRFQNRIE